MTDRRTLTQMLKIVLPDKDEPELGPIKELIKEWLSMVSIPSHTHEVMGIRRLLITLVDEP